MRRRPMSLRLSDEEAAALARAAAADHRPPAALARLILAEWLTAQGHLDPSKDGRSSEPAKHHRRPTPSP